MNIFVYSDESGVFDIKNEGCFVFGGIIFLSKSDKENATHKYAAIEKIIRNNLNYPLSRELKAKILPIKTKYNLYRSLNRLIKFGVIIEVKMFGLMHLPINRRRRQL